MRGRTIWFERHPDGGGVYRAVTREGRRAFALAAAWVVACGVAGMAAFALTWNPWWFVAMFAGEAAGLAVFVATVRRHS